VREKGKNERERNRKKRNERERERKRKNERKIIFLLPSHQSILIKATTKIICKWK